MHLFLSFTIFEKASSTCTPHAYNIYVKYVLTYLWNMLKQTKLTKIFPNQFIGINNLRNHHKTSLNINSICPLYPEIVT